MDNDPGGIAEIADQGGDVCLLSEWPESGGRELKAGWCASLPGGFEPNKEFEPRDAGAVCVGGSVSNRFPEGVELVEEVFIRSHDR